MRPSDVLVAALACVAFAGGAVAATAIVVRGETALRAEPRDSGRQLVLLAQGEALEVRGGRMDYLHVWDHRRERGGFVRAAHVRQWQLVPQEAPELLALVRHLRDTPGQEALGVALVAAYVEAVPAAVLQGESGGEALEALGAFATRLAQRGKGAEAQLDVAASYGVRFASFE